MSMTIQTDLILTWFGLLSAVFGCLFTVWKIGQWFGKWTAELKELHNGLTSLLAQKKEDHSLMWEHINVNLATTESLHKRLIAVEKEMEVCRGLMRRRGGMSDGNC